MQELSRGMPLCCTANCRQPPSGFWIQGSPRSPCATVIALRCATMPQPSFTSCSLVVSVGSGPGSVIVLKAPADRLGGETWLMLPGPALDPATLIWCKSF